VKVVFHEDFYQVYTGDPAAASGRMEAVVNVEGHNRHRYIMNDPIHPNGRGYTKMAQKFYQAMQPYL
jgi:hypothetical protein